LAAPEIRFSRHAEQQLRERDIEPELVRQTPENPELVSETGRNRKVAQRTYQRHGRDFLLRVVFTEQDIPEIVTAYWTSKVSKYRRK
jgi:hypothetical protein